MPYDVKEGEVARCAIVVRGHGSSLVLTLKEYERESFEVPCSNPDAILTQPGDRVRVVLFDESVQEVVDRYVVSRFNIQVGLTHTRGSRVENLTFAGLD